MGRILKFAGVAAGFLGYLWFAGVRNLDEVKARKRARRAATFERNEPEEQ